MSSFVFILILSVSTSFDVQRGREEVSQQQSGNGMGLNNGEGRLRSKLQYKDRGEDSIFSPNCSATTLLTPKQKISMAWGFCFDR